MKARPFLALTLLLGLAALACGGINPAPQPVNVETVVAATFQALTASAPGANPPADTPAPLPATGGLLPRVLYFLNADSAGFLQVYRLEKDGKTTAQITFEPANVEAYDVAQDGGVVYVSNNQLLMVAADGSGRRMLVDGGAVDVNNPYLNQVSNPVISPNNETVAYGHQGLNFYSLATGQSNRVLDNQVEDLGNGLFVPREMYWPEAYTADGGKLLISIGYYEGASAAIYYPSSSTVVRLSGDVNAMICCGNAEWTGDGSLFYAASPTLGMFPAGLWRVDALTGKVTALLTGDYEANPADVANAPFPAPDGNLYYFYASVPNTEGFISRPPLQLVRSKLDGVTERVVLRPETYQDMNEALWAPDGSFVLVTMAQTPEAYSGGLLQLVYTDGSQGVISLIPYATKLKWGP